MTKEKSQDFVPITSKNSASVVFLASPVCTLCSWKSRTLYCLKIILMYFFTWLSVCPHVWSPIRLPACHPEFQSACQPICQPAYPLVLYVNLFVSHLYLKYIHLFVQLSVNQCFNSLALSVVKSVIYPHVPQSVNLRMQK